MTSLNRDARIAGLLYLVFSIVGFFALEYGPSKLFVAGNASATAHNIATHQRLFLYMIVAELLGGLLGLIVSLALYRLFKGVDQIQASLLLIFGGFMVTPLYFLNILNYVAALLFVNGTTFLAVFSEPQRVAMAMLFLRLHHYELLASVVFAGLWLFPFGILVYKSDFLPRVLGIWLIVNGFAYLAVTTTGFL